jgi:hypothetical protein
MKLSDIKKNGMSKENNTKIDIKFLAMLSLIPISICIAMEYKFTQYDTIGREKKYIELRSNLQQSKKNISERGGEPNKKTRLQTATISKNKEKAASKSKKRNENMALFDRDRTALEVDLNSTSPDINNFIAKSEQFLKSYEHLSTEKFYTYIKQVNWSVKEYIKLKDVANVVTIFNDKSRESALALSSFCQYAKLYDRSTPYWKNSYKESFTKAFKSHPWYKRINREKLKAKAIELIINHRVNYKLIKEGTKEVHPHHC